jgi:hypothetical protein
MDPRSPKISPHLRVARETSGGRAGVRSMQTSAQAGTTLEYCGTECFLDRLLGLGMHPMKNMSFLPLHSGKDSCQKASRTLFMQTHGTDGQQSPGDWMSNIPVVAGKFLQSWTQLHTAAMNCACSRRLRGAGGAGSRSLPCCICSSQVRPKLGVHGTPSQQGIRMALKGRWVIESQHTCCSASLI